jgi:putative transposase
MCFIVDVFSRRIVGWRVATTMHTDMVLDALEMACFHRGTHLDGLICHTDAVSQFTSVCWRNALTKSAPAHL